MLRDEFSGDIFKIVKNWHSRMSAGSDNAGSFLIAKKVIPLLHGKVGKIVTTVMKNVSPSVDPEHCWAVGDGHSAIQLHLTSFTQAAVTSSGSTPRSRSLPLSTRHFLRTLQTTSLRTAASSPMLVQENCRLRLEHHSSVR